MRVRGALLVSVLVLAGCGGSNPTAAHTTPSAATATASSTAVATPTTSAGPPSAVHCSSAVPPGDALVIGMVVGDPTVVVRDIQDPANAKTLCSFDSNVLSPQFVNGSTVAYVTTDGQLVEAPLAGGPTTVVATFSGPATSSGPYAVSPDGKSVSYVDGNTWRLVGPAGNRLLATLGPVPGRGVNPDEDDNFLGFSPDGQYVAYFSTIHTGSTGPTAPDQVRKVSDGSLVYSTSGVTMAVWASVPSRLFFRDATGNVHRWDPSAGLSSMTSLHWIRPRSSPDGRWIAYTFRTSSGVDGVGFYSVQSNAQQNTTPPGRSGVVFLNNDLVWYFGEKPCSTCGIATTTPTGVTYIYSIASASEVTSRLANVYDAWPRVTAPGL